MSDFKKELLTAAEILAKFGTFSTDAAAAALENAKSLAAAKKAANLTTPKFTNGSRSISGNDSTSGKK